ncbi:uncharacterized protein LOC126900752 [Daktulosphaira vitifoliae]|uniref:uncharacterized protein LOC126900752 n=1 Tax=Daktulosphaira vitifoliae TaxID=58002 RepID=UPI0021A9D6AB|nr:uncharacterized protein LOC126900752 [Daktulosphaira vitifoliae]
MTGEKLPGKCNEPVAFHTIFGWTVMGPVESLSQPHVTSLLVISNDELDQSLTNFWTIEEPPQTVCISPEDKQAEEHYNQTMERLPSGRYMLSLPFRSNKPYLGESKQIDYQRLLSLEKKLGKNADLRNQYHAFMQNYLDSRHMELIPFNERSNRFFYYIPHQCVLRPDSSTTKLRVVFNASSHTSLGMSLNDHLLTGQKLQSNLQYILLRSRLYKYVITPDSKQMYRQILIQPYDRLFAHSVEI